jgi:serine/threonine protein kinase
LTPSRGQEGFDAGNIRLLPRVSVDNGGVAGVRVPSELGLRMGKQSDNAGDRAEKRAASAARRGSPRPAPSRAEVTAAVEPSQLLSRPPVAVAPGKPLALGSMLGKYRLTAVLGTGGMGTVYEAVDSLIKRKVAIKVLSPQLAAADAGVIARLLGEAQAAGKLNHPNVVTIYDVDRVADGPAKGTLYIVMELLTGGSVQDYLARRGSPGWRAATRLVAEACKALGAAHDAGLIHRDIKPSNLMLTADGHVKVTDFGLAKLESPDAAMQTTPGAILGTPAFMSPEQCRGDKLDLRTDVYSLGCAYYATLTGKPPFEAASSLQVMFAHCSAAIPDPRELSPDVPDACIEIVRKALAKDPSERYANAREMLADLRAVLGGQTVTAAHVPVTTEALEQAAASHADVSEESVWRPPLRKSRPRWMVWAASATGVLVLAGAIVFVMIRASSSSSDVAVDSPVKSAPRVVPSETEAPKQETSTEVMTQAPAPAPVAAPATAPVVANAIAASPTPAPSTPQAAPLPATLPTVVVPPDKPKPTPAQRPELPASITNSAGIKLTLIKPGKFMMGDERMPDAPKNQVTLTRPFYMGVTEVTQGQLVNVMGEMVRAKAKREELPAAFITWEEARNFCQLLSDRDEEKQAHRVYRLPTEAEWEYCCRAGSTSRYAFGDTLTPEQAVFNRKISLVQLRRGAEGGGDERPPAPPEPGRRRLAAGERPRRGEPPEEGPGPGGEQQQRPLEKAGSFSPNAWGLYDMHGSVWEWCSDWYSNKAYKEGSRVNPTGPEAGKTHVARGGCYSSPMIQCASAYRNGNPQPSLREPAYGFRVVCEIRE